MSVPQCKFDDTREELQARVSVPPDASATPSSGPSCLHDDYDPEVVIATLRQFREELSEDPEADWVEFLEFARAIDQDRPPGMRHFDQYLME
jgi:hypothetical protein